MKFVVEFGPQLLAFTLALIQLRRLPIAYKFITVQLFITLVTDLLAMYYINNSKSNEGIYNVYILFEMVLISAAIYYSISNLKFKNLIKYSILLFVPLAISSFVFGSMKELNYPVLIIAFISVSFFNLYFIIHPKSEKSILKNPMIIIAIGHVIYFLGVTPYFVGRHFLIEAFPDIADILFSYINQSLAAIRYLFIAGAFGILLVITKRAQLA